MRLIDADAPREQILDWISEQVVSKYATHAECIKAREGARVALNMLEVAPTVDAVEVVRCKDCKHNGTWQCHMEYDEYYPEADIHHEMHGDDDFCSYGVKEDGESNDE